MKMNGLFASLIFVFVFSVERTRWSRMLNYMEWLTKTEMQIWLMYILFFRSKVLWPLLLVILLPMKLTTGCGFSSTAIFVNNSVPSELLASANGLAMTAAATCRYKRESRLVSGKNVTNDTKCRLKQGLTIN